MSSTNLLTTFQNVSAEAWLALAGVLLGSILTTFGVWLTNRSNLKNLKIQLEYEKISEQQRAKRERLEELYVLTGNWLTALNTHALTLTSVMQGKLDYNQYLDLTIKNAESQKYDFNRIEMIIDIYGGELSDAYKKVIEARSQLNIVQSEHKRVYLRGESGERFIKPFVAIQTVLDVVGKDLKKEIAACAGRP